LDAGSGDPGPFNLGAGKSFSDREAVKRDLRLILCAARQHDIPVLIGSAGGAGAPAPDLSYDEGRWSGIPEREHQTALRGQSPGDLATPRSHNCPTSTGTAPRS